MEVNAYYPLHLRHDSVKCDYKGRKSRQIKATVLASAVLCFGLASNGFAQDGEERPKPPTDNVLATVRTADGAVVQFVESGRGEIAVVAQAPVTTGNPPPTAINGISLEFLDSLNAVQKYEALTNAEAPAALVAAQASAEAAATAESATEQKANTKTKLPKLSKEPKAELYGAWFQQNYCPSSGYAFNFCLLDRTGDGYITTNASYIRSTLYPERGNVSHKLEYRSCVLFWCNWHTNISYTVLQGYVGWIWVSGSHRGRRATVYEGYGDHFHWAVYGN